jgi:hypothetical protein
MIKRGASKALLAAYTALESEIEHSFDKRTKEGNYRRVLSRLESWHALRWFSDFLDNGNVLSVPDPLAREEYVIEFFAPLIKPPSVALVDGVGIVASALGVSSVICPAGPKRDLGCDLFRFNVAGSNIQSARGIDKNKTFLCIDKLASGSMAGGGIADFLIPIANSMKPDATLLFSDKLCYQDDVVECLVMLDFEIELLESKPELDLVLLQAIR